MRISDWSSDVCSSDLEIRHDCPAVRIIGIGKDDRSSGRVFQLVKRDRSAVDEHFGMSSVGWGQVEGLARKDVAEQPQDNLRTRQGAQGIGIDRKSVV